MCSVVSSFVMDEAYEVYHWNKFDVQVTVHRDNSYNKTN